MQSESGDEAPAAARQAGVATVLLAAEQVGDMHLHHRCGNGFHGIGEYDGGMSVGSWIKDDAIIASGSDATDQFVERIRLNEA